MGAKQEGAELLADEIAQKIHSKIQFQEYKPGQRLTVRLLCEEFGASETPVKQALNQLLGTGLVVSIPKCGMRVREFNFQEMKNIWEARLMIEQYCAPAVIEAAKHDEVFVDRICSLIRISNEEYERCARDYTKANFNILPAHDGNIHTELVKCCRNDQIIEMYAGLNSHAGMFVGYHSHSPESLLEVVEQHTGIMNQILRCDVEGLKRILEQHIYSTIQIYRNSHSENI